MSRARRGSGGFTLIELVVALAVLALASLLIVEGLRFGLRAWDAVSGRLARAGDVSIAQEVLRDRIAQIDPDTTTPVSGQSPAGPVQGHAGEMSFTAPGPHVLAGRYLRYRIYLDRAAGALKLAWQAAGQGPDEEVLLQGVDDLGFDYFSRGDNDRGRWTPDWTGEAKPPLLVRLRLHFAQGGAADWPALVVRPRISMTAACEFDLVSRRCR